VLKTGQKSPVKGRQVSEEIILWAVRWDLQFLLRYRALERMLADRGVRGDHTPLFRWLQACAYEAMAMIGKGQVLDAPAPDMQAQRDVSAAPFGVAA
jgi:transposase-like protein